MNKNQWNLLSIVFILTMVFFISIDSTWGGRCGYYSDEHATALDVTACVNAEIYEPFIYLTFILAIVFQILSWLESKKH